MPREPSHEPGDAELDFGDDFFAYTPEERMNLAAAVRHNRANGIPLNPLQARFDEWSRENFPPDNDVPWKR